MKKAIPSAAAALAALAVSAAAPSVSVCRFHEGKSAVFLLAFDDACPTHLANAIPVLERHRVPGTFYLITEAGQFTGRRADWARAAKSEYVFLGNHTSTHRGVNAADELDAQLDAANAVLRELEPGRPWPRLISFAVPGGVPWKISKDELKAKLDARFLVERPNFQSPPWFCKTVADAEAYIDRCIAEGRMGHIDFHGIGGDWLSNETGYLEGVAKKLDSVRDRMWLAGAEDWNRYSAERDAAKVKVEARTATAMKVTVSIGDLDPKVYDHPLTLEFETKWPSARVTAGKAKSVVKAKDGKIRFQARPGEAVTLARGG